MGFVRIRFRYWRQRVRRMVCPMNEITFDEDGLIVQRNGDGGDCAARCGEYLTFFKAREMMGIDNSDWPKLYWPQTSGKLQALSGQVLRYDKPPYDKYNDVSRDQTMPMVIAGCFYRDLGFVSGVVLDIRENASRFPNGDFCSPMESACFDRVFGRPHILGDIQMIFAVIVRCIYGAISLDDVGDDINLTLYLVQAFFFHPTWPTKIATWLYGKLRRKGVQYAFDHYHRPETGGNPINDLARPVIKEVFG